MAVEVLESRELLAAIDDWTQVGPGGGGAIFSPAINPHDHSEMFIASDMSQLFHSVDEGESWETLDFRNIQGNWATNVQFTSDPEVMYAVDYSLIDLEDAASPAKSTDGGETWTRLASDPTDGEVFTLLADYDDPDRIIVTDWTSLYVSDDGGQSFQERFSTDDSDFGLHVGGALFDGSRIFIGTNQGLLISGDGGLSFDVQPLSGVPTDERIVSFAGATEGGTTRLYVVTMFEGDVFAGVRGIDHEGYRGIYKRDLDQATWSRYSDGIAADANPFFVAAPANDVDVVYVAGGSDNGTPTVYISTNSAESWASALLTDGNENVATGWSGHAGARGWSYGENALGFTIARNDPNRVLITDFGFAHYTADGGRTWQVLNVVPEDRNLIGNTSAIDRGYRSSGLDNTSIWGVTWVDQTHLIGLYSDIRGAISDDGGQSWSFNYTGHNQNSMYRSVVSDTGTAYAATSTVHDMYQSTHLLDSRIDGGAGKALFSSDRGQSWLTLHDFGHVVTWVELDPNNPNRLYASVAHSNEGGIYVSDNIQEGTSSTWHRLPDPPRTEGHPFNLRVLDDGTLVATFSGRRAGLPTAFTPSSGVFVSIDDGQTWQDRSDNGMLYWTRDIEIDPHDADQDTWYASVFSGWGGPPNGLGGLYKTTNRGQSWERIVALDRVASATISPTDPNELYLTTESEGLWYTDNLNGTPTFTQVTGFPFRNPMRVVYNPFNPNEVWVTSFGHGLHVGRNNPPALMVKSLAPTNSGFMAEFSADFDANVLNLYDTQTAGLGPADVVLQGATSGEVAGSLVVDPSSRMITFIKTGGLLVADSYTVTLRSATDGFKNVAGNLLDGDGNGTAGDDFSDTFLVGVTDVNPILTVSLPDFVRGPGQDVNLPADTIAGIPLSISDGTNVRVIDLRISYDPALIDITAATVAPGMPAGSTVVLNNATPGLAIVTLTSSTDLPLGNNTFVNLQATVPTTNPSAIYRRQEVLDIHTITIRDARGNEFSVIDDDALHAVTFFGDVSGNGRVNASDAAQVARFAALIDSGFAASLVTDPIVVGDISGNGRINAADASRVAQFAALIAVPEIPPIPAGVAVSGVADLGPGLPDLPARHVARATSQGTGVKDAPLLPPVGPHSYQAVDTVMASMDMLHDDADQTHILALEDAMAELLSAELLAD